MNKLIGGMFILLLIGCLIAAAIAVAIAMVVAGALGGAVVALAQGSAAFVMDYSRAIFSRGGSRRTPRSPEPAYELYVLGQLQRDLRHALASGWAALQRLRGACARFAQRHGQGVKTPLGIGAVLGGYLGTLLAGVLGVIVAVPVVLVSIFCTAGAWALVGVLRVAETLRRQIRRTSYECAVDHERFPLPVYVCPGCGGEHRQLVPGRWGLFRRECACDTTSLPTMVMNGRQRVPQFCPSGHPMSGLIGYAGRLGVPIVAGPRAGKSTYLAAAMLELEELAASGRLALEVVDESRNAYDQAVDGLRSGVVPRKTALTGNAALVTEVQGTGRSRVLYVYDVAGESYASADEVRALRFLHAPSGLVLLVDPLALPDVAEEHAEQLARDEDAVRPSPEHPMRTFERTAAALSEAGFNARRVPIAVVVGKVDAFGLDGELSRFRTEHGDDAPRAWLEAHGAGNLVRAIEHDFADATFPSRSASVKRGGPG